MTTDKKTIGLTPHGREVMDQVMEKDYFKDQMDAAKFAISLAINKDVKTESIEGTETNWNIGSFDSEGELKSLISAIYPNTSTPYRFIECLIDAGLGIVGKHLEKNRNLMLSDLMSLNKQT